MKIAVVGCGAMGTLFSGKLSEDNEVIMIDTYHSLVEKINKDGIEIISIEGTKNYYPKAYLSGQYLEVVDLVIMFVKSTQNIAAITENKAIVGKNTIVLSLQNGSGNDKDLEKYFDSKRIVIGNTLYNCVSKGFGITDNRGKGITTIGSLVGNDEVCKTVQNVLLKAGFETKINDNIQQVIWHKIFINCTLNPLTSIFNCKIKTVYENKYIWNILCETLKEAILVAKNDGSQFNYDEILLEIRQIINSIGNGYPSMQQDITNRRYTEIDKINGAIVRVAYENGINVPYNEFIVNAIKALEKLY